MLTFILTVYVIVCLLMIILIIIQQGKGAEAGASFGSGASGTVFGAAGSGNFLTRTTGILAAIFFLLSLVLAYMANKAVKQPITPSAPATAQVGSATPASSPPASSTSASVAPASAPVSK